VKEPTAEQHVTAVDRLTDKSRDPWFIPWALDAPRPDHAYFNGLWGPINLAFAGVLPRNDEKIEHVIRWNIEKTHKGSRRGMLRTEQACQPTFIRATAR
jgi:hypothetical protein